jgi:hypothetical protein
MANTKKRQTTPFYISTINTDYNKETLQFQRI